DKLGLDPESAYLLERYYKDFVRAGAKLSDSEKQKLKEINAELAKLQTDFEQNVLKERNASSVVIDKKEELAGLTDDQMKSVNKLLADLAPPAIANAKREAAEQQKIVDQEKGAFQIGACDWNFYSEKVRKAKYNFDESEVRPYYELNHVIVDGVFFAANKEYGLTFKERHDLPVYEPDVRVWEVFDRDGKPLAIFIGDYYTRASKRGGAWMNAYVPQNDLFR